MFVGEEKGDGGGCVTRAEADTGWSLDTPLRSVRTWLYPTGCLLSSFLSYHLGTEALTRVHSL